VLAASERVSQRRHVYEHRRRLQLYLRERLGGA